MSLGMNADPKVTAKVINLIEREKAMALSARELQHRLAGYGYAIVETEEGHIVESLPHHVEVCKLPMVGIA